MKNFPFDASQNIFAHRITSPERCYYDVLSPFLRDVRLFSSFAFFRDINEDLKITFFPSFLSMCFGKLVSWEADLMYREMKEENFLCFQVIEEVFRCRDCYQWKSTKKWKLQHFSRLCKGVLIKGLNCEHCQTLMETAVALPGIVIHQSAEETTTGKRQSTNHNPLPKLSCYVVALSL
jgi:hypothetical protein